MRTMRWLYKKMRSRVLVPYWMVLTFNIVSLYPFLEQWQQRH